MLFELGFWRLPNGKGTSGFVWGLVLRKFSGRFLKILKRGCGYRIHDVRHGINPAARANTKRRTQIIRAVVRILRRLIEVGNRLNLMPLIVARQETVLARLNRKNK